MAKLAHDSKAHRFDAYSKCGVCAQKVCVLTWGDLHRERCNWTTTLPGLVPPGYQDPSAVASCPLRVEETGSNVIHEYSATRSNAGRDGAEVSSGHK
jgi:hypothetical protein